MEPRRCPGLQFGSKQRLVPRCWSNVLAAVETPIDYGLSNRYKDSHGRHLRGIQMNSGSVKVFLSHAMKDGRATAEQMKAQLCEQAIDAFACEPDIAFGEPIWEKIESRIRHCDYFLVLLTPCAYRSDSVARELALAKALRRKRGSRPVIIGVRPPRSDKNLATAAH
jgi:hypothetical protein